jgi:hypothetical protein
VRHAHLLDLDLRFCRLDTGLGSRFGLDQLADLLFSHGATALHTSGAVGFQVGVGGSHFGFGQLRLGSGQVGCNRIGCQHRQHLARLDRVTDIGPQFGNAQPLRLCANTGFLPGCNAAVGGQTHGHLAGFRLNRLHSQSRACGRCGHGWRRSLGERPAGQQGQGCDRKPHAQGAPVGGVLGMEVGRRFGHGLHGVLLVRLWHGCLGQCFQGRGSAGSQPPPTARYRDTQAEARSRWYPSHWL